MSVNGVTAATDSASGAAAMKKATGMNKDDFLKLFITQMKNQDPLSPMDSTEFLGQLAQLTQVEQAYNTNSNLESLITAFSSSNSFNAVSFLGTTIHAYGDQVALVEGAQPTLTYDLSKGATGVTVQIFDSAGQLVRTITGGAASAGTNSLVWDGKGNNGKVIPAGTYSVSVAATDAAGTKFSGTPMIQGKVDGINWSGTTPMLSVNGIDVPLASVIKVKGA